MYIFISEKIRNSFFNKLPTALKPRMCASNVIQANKSANELKIFEATISSPVNKLDAKTNIYVRLSKYSQTVFEKWFLNPPSYIISCASRIPNERLLTNDTSKQRRDAKNQRKLAQGMPRT